MKPNSINSANTINKPLTARITLIISIILLSSCAANAGSRHYDYESPPSGTFDYHYYPNAHVYFDSHRHLYHYHHKQRGWQSVKKLPKYIHIDKQRRYSVRSDHRRPWKNQHLQKKHRGHIDKHFDSHDKKALKHRHGYKSRSRRHAIISHQTQHNDGMAHHDGNRQHKKHRADVYQQRKSNWQRVPKQDHKNIRPANKFTDRKVDNRHRAADKNTDRKMQNKQRHRKREPRRAEFKKNKNRATRNDRGSRQKAKHKRN